MWLDGVKLQILAKKSLGSVLVHSHHICIPALNIPVLDVNICDKIVCFFIFYFLLLGLFSTSHTDINH